MSSFWAEFACLFLAALAAPAAVVLGTAAFSGTTNPPPRHHPPVPEPFVLGRPYFRPQNPNQIDRIGIILVHGIGEQRRFQHLDSQSRDLLRALRALLPPDQVSVDITSSGAAAFQAEQDTWNAGPRASVTVQIDHTFNGFPQRAQVFIHEVWWADVNEPYSLAKQFRFWLWGLAIWAHPFRPNAAGLPSASSVASPVIRRRSLACDRVRLWAVGGFFVLLGYSIGAVTFLLSRLFNLQQPSLLRTLTNYISAVKLYNQGTRYGPGLLWQREEFLDTIDQPPRVSVRRRMIRAIADVACNRYHRWYILAHSQGTVVALNGLMETAYAWPGYLDERRWNRLRNRNMAGEMAGTAQPPPGSTMPPRPNWAAPREIAYRSRVFSRFRGFLTYGSPIQKFAGIWPALVPISREPAFRRHIPWLNLFDPLDPVSGRLLAYQHQPPACCPRALDLGYAAYWGLLAAHLKYLSHHRSGDAARMIVRWLLTDDPRAFNAPPIGWALGSWFGWNSPQRHVRSAVAWITWAVVAVAIGMLGAITLPLFWEGLVTAFWTVVSHGLALIHVAYAPKSAGSAGPFSRIWASYWLRMLFLIDVAAWATILIGTGARLGFFKAEWVDPTHVPVPPDDPAFRRPSQEPQPGTPEFRESEDDPGEPGDRYGELA